MFKSFNINYLRPIGALLLTWRSRELNNFSTFLLSPRVQFFRELSAPPDYHPSPYHLFRSRLSSPSSVSMATISSGSRTNRVLPRSTYLSSPFSASLSSLPSVSLHPPGDLFLTPTQERRLVDRLLAIMTSQGGACNFPGDAPTLVRPMVALVHGISRRSIGASSSMKKFCVTRRTSRERYIDRPNSQMTQFVTKIC